MTTRYQVKGQYMDGIAGWFVVDTHHDFYKMYPNDYSSFNCFGLSMKKQEMIELAEKMNKEAAS
jgi:hypothetical protein